MVRSSFSWWMAWSGRLRMTASSARTHMGSRALSCTTGNLPHHPCTLRQDPPWEFEQEAKRPYSVGKQGPVCDLAEFAI